MTEQNGGPLELTYESAAEEPLGPRPKWVWVLIALYLLAATAVLLFPAFVALNQPSETGLILFASGTAFMLTLSSLAMMFTPVHKARRRRITRASVWIPILASGMLIGLLLVGAALAITEYFTDDKGPAELFYGIWIGGGAVWVAWSVLLWWLTSYIDPTSLAGRLHRWVLGGSVVELLVAVPTHLVVRKRPYCCAGILTGTGIAIGVVAMIAALGPGVVFLYYKRWKRLAGK